MAIDYKKLEDEWNEKFNQADKKVHPVEVQWHYPILTEAGFVAQTKEGIGFSRSYVYERLDGHKIKATTGINCDYWKDMTTGKTGYGCDLKGYVGELINE